MHQTYRLKLQELLKIEMSGTELRACIDALCEKHNQVEKRYDAIQTYVKKGDKL